MNIQQTPPPTSYVYGIPPRPKSWLIWSILATLICCNLLGIVGIVNAIRVNTLYDQTKYEEAKKAFKKLLAQEKRHLRELQELLGE